MKKRLVLSLAAVAAVSVASLVFLFAPQQKPDGNTQLRVGIAPYQDMAMLAAAKPKQIDSKHGLDLKLVSMQWADLTPAIASANPGVDVVFASLIQFISQEHSLNANSKDPLVFFYPAYVFKGGAFVTFNSAVPEISKQDLENTAALRKFLSFRFAVQRTSSYEILLHNLATRAGVRYEDLSRTDIDSSEGLLAAINGAVDVAAAGLTQKNEAAKRGGRVVLEMAALGQIDIAGFVARRSTIEKRSQDLEKLMRVWTDSVDFVYSDIETNSSFSLAYLRSQSSTSYSVDEYKAALSQEWLPKSINEVNQEIMGPMGKYYYLPVVRSVTSYYISNRLIPAEPKNIAFLNIQ